MTSPDKRSPRQREPENEHRMLVLDAYARDRAEGQPQRGEAPFMMRTTIQAHSSQKSGSNAFIERKLSKAR